MSKIGTNELRAGMKIEHEGAPYEVVNVQFVKPGKGQPFIRTKFKHLLAGKVIERTFKSGEWLKLADVEESSYRLTYQDGDSVHFMHDDTYEQISVSLSVIGDRSCYLMEGVIYELLIYNGSVVDVIPPTFLNMTIRETAPGIRGDSVSGRVMKPAVTETGATIQVPIFIEEGEKVKVDTRTGSYVSRI